MELLLPLTITALSTLLTYHIAIKKALNVKFWVIMAIIFGFLVLPFILFAKDNSKKNMTNKRIDFLEA